VKIVKTTIIYTILGFLPLSFAFVFTPIYLKYLSPEQYGILNLFNVYSGILATIYSLGVSSAFGFVYWDYYQDKEKLQSFLASTIGLILTIQAVVFAILFLFGDQILKTVLKTSESFSFYPFGILTLIYPLFSVFYELLLPYYRNENKINLYAIINISSLILMTIGSVIGIISLDLKVEGAIYGKTIGYSIVVGSFVLHLILKVGLKVKIKESLILFRFGMPLMISTIIGGIAYNLDKIMIEQLSTLTDLGIYGLAVVIVSVIEVLFNALNNALSPVIFRYLKDDYLVNKKQIQGLSYLMVLVSLFAVMMVILIAKPVLYYVAPEEYADAINFIPLLGIAMIFRVFSSIKSYIFYIESKTKILPFVQVFNLVTIYLLSIIFFEYFGVVGIAYAVLGSKFLDLVVVSYIVRKISEVRFGFKNLYFVVALCVASVFFIASTAFQESSFYLYSLPFITLLIAVFIFAKKESKSIVELFKKGFVK
jgi:O-antigen/teichoic acid export membrane protein